MELDTTASQLALSNLEEQLALRRAEIRSAGLQRADAIRQGSFPHRALGRLRRRFLTFVNLFGAVLTLTVLVVAYAILDSIVSPAGAQHRQNHILAITSVWLAGERGSAISGPGMAFHERYRGCSVWTCYPRRA